MAHFPAFRLLCLSLAVLACESKGPPKPAPAAASASPSVSAASRSQPAVIATAPRRAAGPMGPRLALLPGQGVGAIRIGATVPTIERLLGMACELKTESSCRYIDLALEFTLENGATTAIRAYRPGRPAGKNAAGLESEYGYFNGAIPPDLMFGMLPQAIQEHLGQPQRVERRDVVGPADAVETHYYDGIVLEYDRIANGNLVLGSAQVVKGSGAPSDPGAAKPKPGAAKPAAPPVPRK
ncbi:MAG TPA: hypothetical protein VFQ61_31695 [Polyangiaceae bacterium]|nr:hypothetical protein [Polyangiaceae bacterium]